MENSLTRAAIESAIARARTDSAQIELQDDREPGLRFRAGERSASWSLLVRLQTGQRSRVRLGSWPGLSIAEARRAARAARVRIESGQDPNAEKRAAARQAAVDARNRTALRDVLDTYERQVLVHHRRGLKTRWSLDGKKGLLTTLRARALSSITRDELIALVRKHAARAPISANRKLAHASAFFNWCIDEGLLQTNPATRIRKPGKERVRERFHSLPELREIWAAAGTLGYPFAQLYRLLIVVPNRREEIAGMRLEELDPAQGKDLALVWTLPSERTKRENSLRVPLPRLARDLIREAIEHPERPKKSEFLFTTTGDTSVSGFTKGKRRLDKAILAAREAAAIRAGEDPARCEQMAHWTIHDLRTTFNTHACEILNVPPHVADRILNHVATATRSKVMRIYNKSELFEPRRDALDAWAALLERSVTGKAVEDTRHQSGSSGSHE